MSNQANLFPLTPEQRATKEHELAEVMALIEGQNEALDEVREQIAQATEDLRADAKLHRQTRKELQAKARGLLRDLEP